MLKRAARAAAVVALTASSAIAADRPFGAFIVPGTGHEIDLGASRPTQRTAGPEDALVAAIAAWVAAGFDLPLPAELPQVELVARQAMMAVRLGEAPSGLWQGDGSDEVVAVYDDVSRTIYLPLTWTGVTAAELSILVHETVHHLQNMAGQRFICPAEREKLAFAAQDRWLAMFGGDLSLDFGIDPFTLLVRTTCGL